MSRICTGIHRIVGVASFTTWYAYRPVEYARLYRSLKPTKYIRKNEKNNRYHNTTRSERRWLGWMDFLVELCPAQQTCRFGVPILENGPCNGTYKLCTRNNGIAVTSPTSRSTGYHPGLESRPPMVFIPQYFQSSVVRAPPSSFLDFPLKLYVCGYYCVDFVVSLSLHGVLL